MKKVVVISLLVLAIIVGGCSSSPPESLVVDHLNRADNFKVVSVKKLDGQSSEVSGVKHYKMKIEAVIECTEFYWACAGAETKPDHRTTYTGTAFFVQSEKGWQIDYIQQN